MAPVSAVYSLCLHDFFFIALVHTCALYRLAAKPEARYDILYEVGFLWSAKIYHVHP